MNTMATYISYKLVYIKSYMATIQGSTGEDGS
jgi:hypothetical protein